MLDTNLVRRIKSKARLALWTLGPIGFGVALVFIFSVIPSISLLGKGALNSANALKSLAAEPDAPIAFKYAYFNKDITKTTNQKLNVSATAYVVGDLNTGEVILSKNQDRKLPIASISKLMTALVATEIIDPENTATVSKRAIATYGDNGNFKAGEKIKTPELIYPLLLESSNDAAEVIAEHFGRETFLRKMNTQAEILQMSSTSFEDPSGLSPKNQSTAEDLFKLVGYLNRQKKDLLSVTTKRSYSTQKHSWSNISQFLHKDGYQGGKSGYTDAAKQTVVSLFSLPLSETGNRPIAITLLGSRDRAKDVETILKYLEKNIYYGGLADANTNWVTEKVGSPEIRDPDFLTLAFAGDIMLDRGVRNSVIKNFNNDYAALFSKPDLSNILKKSDITFANLEGTASDQGSDGGGLYSFRMDPAVIPAMAGAGIKVLSVANNHIGDWGRTAYVDTLGRLKENEILYTGGGMNKEEAETPVIIEKYGMKIGFLGFSDVGPDSMEAENDRAGQLLASNPRFEKIIKSAKAQVDFLVVSFHFGDEYKTEHNKRQEELAHSAIDNGAKIVIGHHPHVIENTEVYKDGFIAYSLGNFVFDQAFSRNTMEGMLLELKLGRDGSLTARENIVRLNPAFQPDQIIKGAEKKIKFNND